MCAPTLPDRFLARRIRPHTLAPTPMDTSASPSLKQVVLADVEPEFATTRRVLERLPEEHFDWRPHPKSFPLGHLAAHVANLPMYGAVTLQSDHFDLASAPPPATDVPTTRAEILDRFDRNVTMFREALEATEDDALAATWTLRRGEQVFLQQLKSAALRAWAISHMVHHRGQLSVYLRLLDVPVPSIYGPSADEATF